MSFPFVLMKPLLDYEHMKLYIGILIMLHFHGSGHSSSNQQSCIKVIMLVIFFVFDK
jgi:hypothetical protein